MTIKSYQSDFGLFLGFLRRRRGAQTLSPSGRGQGEGSFKETVMPRPALLVVNQWWSLTTSEWRAWGCRIVAEDSTAGARRTFDTRRDKPAK